jgi:predicted nucleotidyltransferase
VSPGSIIRDARLRARLSQTDLARRAGVPQSVDLDDGVGLVALAGLARELTGLLGVSVDVVPADTLKRAIRSEVLAEAVPL